MLLMLLALCVGACSCSGVNIHLSHNTNKDIDSPLQYTVYYKKGNQLSISYAWQGLKWLMAIDTEGKAACQQSRAKALSLKREWDNIMVEQTAKATVK